MRKIRMRTAMAGNDFSWAPGDVVEVDDSLAEALCDGIRAEAVEDDSDDDEVSALREQLERTTAELADERTRRKQTESQLADANARLQKSQGKVDTSSTAPPETGAARTGRGRARRGGPVSG